MLIDWMEYKANEKGIDVILIEEKYTSKCSFLDGEKIGHHDECMGKRISRGILIHSDLNAT